MFWIFYFISVAICYALRNQKLYSIPEVGQWIYWVPIVNAIYAIFKVLKYFGIS
jgi:hypothetical protein